MPSRHLYLSSNKPWKSTFTTVEGQVIYKAESGRTITISRILQSLNHGNTLMDSFEHLAEIEYHTFRKSRIRYGGRDQTVNEFFRKQGWGFFGRNRVFTGPNGREYLWKLGSSACKLFLNDSSKAPVAYFHRKKRGILRESRPASLEIFAEGEHMVDLIVVTFVYMEKYRKENEQSTQAGAGAGGG
ncbi:hypothetical protein GALMADRAFT_90776 [Galerina marginata CBS 339.88]|uniref:DUF6593 domain-containing protein n=1 Tax=Galerina marginata (strain CBS 339.88) TaxID=685588 RepID=A0A067TT59_GALM3|nr:hypothetical protein GALMADRAFT_90776 [Galerina marginata CBS 339.88]